MADYLGYPDMGTQAIKAHIQMLSRAGNYSDIEVEPIRELANVYFIQISNPNGYNSVFGVSDSFLLKLKNQYSLESNDLNSGTNGLVISDKTMQLILDQYDGFANAPYGHQFRQQIEGPANEMTVLFRKQYQLSSEPTELTLYKATAQPKGTYLWKIGPDTNNQDAVVTTAFCTFNPNPSNPYVMEPVFVLI